MLYDGVRALVIDDKPYSRMTTIRLLRAMGIRAIADAADGAAGLEAYATLWPHVVICEPEMTPVDGFVFLQSLMTERRALARVAPVIFLSADADENRVAQARQLGAAAYLLKPMSLRSLQRAIDFALTHHGDVYGDAVFVPPAVRPVEILRGV